MYVICTNFKLSYVCKLDYHVNLLLLERIHNDVMKSCEQRLITKEHMQLILYSVP